MIVMLMMIVTRIILITMSFINDHIDIDHDINGEDDDDRHDVISGRVMERAFPPLSGPKHLLVVMMVMVMVVVIVVMMFAVLG